MKYNSKLRHLAIAGVMLVLASVPAWAKPLSLIVGGKSIFLYTAPVADGDEIYVPVPALRAVGAKVWETSAAKDDQQKLMITPASGDRFRVDARVIDGQPMIPIRDIADEIGVLVQWDKDRNTVSLRARLKEIKFDGSKLKVKTSFPLSYEIVESSWTRSEKKFVLDVAGLQIDRDSDDKIDNDTKIPIRLGMNGAETGRLVMDLPFAVRTHKDSAAKTREITISISPSLKDAPAPPERPATPPEDTTMPSKPQTPPAPEPVKVSGIEYHDRGSKRVEVTISADEPVKYTTYMLRGPDRFVIDLSNAKLDGDSIEKSFKHSIAAGLRMTQFNDSCVRAVLDLTRPVAFDVQQARSGEITINLDLPRNAGGSLAGKTITIDAGHGGGETGAIANGCCEKDLNLAIALRVEKMLKDAGAIVLMTRRTDTQVGLKERPAYAARHSADIFLSIHHNAMGTANKISGTEAWYHASDASSRALAMCIQSEVIAANGLPDRGVKSDYVRYPGVGFAVLRGSSMPAALVEVAFLDHAGDAACARSSDFQEKVANGIVRGLKTYIEGSPGTSSRHSQAIEEPGPVEKPRERMTSSAKELPEQVKESVDGGSKSSSSSNSLIPKGRVK